MFEQLSRIGDKLSRLFGEPKYSHPASKNQLKKSQEIFEWEHIAKMLPFEAYDPSLHIFFSSGSLGFVLESIPLVGCDGKIEKDLQSIFTEILEEGDALQFLLFADHRIEEYLTSWINSKKTTHDLFRWIAEKRKEHFLEKTPSRHFRLIVSFSRQIENLFERSTILQVKEKKDRIKKIFDQISPCKLWNAQDFLDTVGALVDFRMEKRQVSLRYNPNQTISGQITKGGFLKVGKDKIDFEYSDSKEVVFKSYRVMDCPTFWSLQAMQNLIGDPYRNSYRINCPFVLQYGIHVPRQSKEQTKFNTRSQLIENQGRSSTLIRMIPELADELKECDLIRREMKQGARFVWTQSSVAIWSEPKNLDLNEQALKSVFHTNEFRLVENRYTQLPSLISLLPLTWAEFGPKLKSLGLTKTTITSECVNPLPIQGEWPGTPSPGILLLGRRGQMMNWNPFDNQTGNYNTIVVGRSGSGKSVFMQEMVFSGISTGAKVFVLDVGRSYEKLCDALSGQQIEFSRDSNVCLNPFSNIHEQDDYEKEAAFSFLKSVISTMAAPKNGTTDYEDALIEKSILFAWENKKTKATITDVASHLSSQQDERAKRIGTMLHPFTKKGNYAKYFEGKNTINFQSPFVLIELEELKEKKDLQSVVLQLYIMEIANQVFLGDRSTPTYIVIDEAWDLLRAKQTGPFIETLARRLRKYFGALVVGTQSLEDFFASEGARAAYENSDWQCFLSQGINSINRFAEKQGEKIDEGQKRAIESLTTRHGEYSEIMIADSNGSYSIGRLYLDPFSQMLYTTKAEEYAGIKKLQKQGLSIVDAISKMVERRTRQR